MLALRGPMTVMVLMVAIAAGCVLALRRMPVDVFPALNLPVIYVCQANQALAAARREYLRCAADYNVAWFTLHRALGWPTREVAQAGAAGSTLR